MLSLVIAIAAVSQLVDAGASQCRCIPSDSCWPSAAQWNSLNSSVSGQLIATVPISSPCYPGSDSNAAECALIDQQWSNASFQANSPVGLSYPTNITCPPVNATANQQPGTCSLGVSPVYAVNATSADQVATTIDFARENNIRLVIKNTGHDILGRSEGSDGLEVWIRYLRTGLSFEKSFQSSCAGTNWTGSAITIGGGYTWYDTYALAKQNDVVVVGGGTPSVSCLGGWMQGGGHGPASREFGLGADQVLSAEVVLSNGSTITASACENQDIYFAIRGGGPGTYGVVTSTTIKAWPNVNAQVQHLAIAPLTNSTNDTSAFLDAVTILFSSYPDLNDAGYAGYGSWSVASPTPLFANFTAGYVHGFYTFNSTLAVGQQAFAPVLAKLMQYNTTNLFISVSYVTYPDYWSFYGNESGVEPPVGTSSALGSRLFSRASVTDTNSLRNTVGIIAGTAEEFTSNNFELVGGGMVFEDASDIYSGLNPAWRITYFNNIVARGWAPGSSEAVMAAVWNDITNVKTAAMAEQAPDTGVYMNEGDRMDPNYELDFYGAHYPRLLQIKQQTDPNGTFYCPTCVGSSAWSEDAQGRLCQVSGASSSGGGSWMGVSMY